MAYPCYFDLQKTCIACGECGRFATFEDERELNIRERCACCGEWINENEECYQIQLGHGNADHVLVCQACINKAYHEELKEVHQVETR